MANTFSLTDGTTTVSLVASGVLTTDYPFYGPNDQEMKEGEVNETISVLLSGTFSEIQSSARNVESLLRAAYRRKMLGVGPRVFLQTQVHGDGTTYRSEVLGGRLTGEHAASQLWRGAVEEQLFITRVPWMEGPETELQLSANGQAAATGGRTVTNDGINNWVQVAAAQVSGTGMLPAPVRVRITNTTGSAQQFETIYAGNNAFASPDTFGYTLQGESRIAGFGTVNSGAAYSGGQYVSITVGAAEQPSVAWNLTSAMMAAGGRWFRLLMRTDSPTYETYIKPVIYNSTGSTILWEGDFVTLRAAPALQLHDLGSIPVPPGDHDESYAPVRLYLHTMAANTYTMNIDFVQLVGTDTFREYRNAGISVANNDYMEFDEIERKFLSVSGGLKTTGWPQFGQPLVVWPNKLQRILFSQRVATGDSFITHTFSVRMWYRPRKLTL